MRDWRGLLLRRPPLRRLLLLLLVIVIVPLLAWVVVKPVRLVAPALVGGLSCNATRSLCVEDPARLAHAAALYEESLLYLAGTLDRPSADTRIVFCSSERCAAAFGLGALRLLLAPRWFVEGMAYGLSDDPRHPLPEPREEWRRRFLEWYAGMDKPTLWERAREL